MLVGIVKFRKLTCLFDILFLWAKFHFGKLYTQAEFPCPHALWGYSDITIFSMKRKLIHENAMFSISHCIITPNWHWWFLFDFAEDARYLFFSLVSDISKHKHTYFKSCIVTGYKHNHGWLYIEFTYIMSLSILNFSFTNIHLNTK